MRKFSEEHRPNLTWFVDDKNSYHKVAVELLPDGGWLVDYWHPNLGNWIVFSTYPTREEAEKVAEVVFITEPWR